MASWPSTLPAPLVSAFSLEPLQAFLRTQMDAGAARQRRRFSVTPTTVPFVVDLSQYNLATFEAWYHFEISDGAGWFTINLRNGLGVVSCEARFSEPYKAINNDVMFWRVSGKLEVRSMPTLTELQLSSRL